MLDSCDPCKLYARRHTLCRLRVVLHTGVTCMHGNSATHSQTRSSTKDITRVPLTLIDQTAGFPTQLLYRTSGQS